jgi:hypothetical protein
MSGMLRFRAICLISLALLPGAWFAWQGREMPAAGYYHDDGLYYVGAQALAQTGEYRITSLPEQPYQTKYPPLWPLVLSLAWQIEPRYPENLPWAMLLAWMWLPVTLLAYRAWLRLAGAEETAGWVLAGLWACNPYVILFSTTLLSEMVFTALLLAALLLLRRGEARWAAAAGLVAGLAFLTRSAGIALLPALVGWLFLRGEFRRAGAFGAVFVPLAAGWFWWAGAHRPAGTDEITLYYTNYFGYHMLVFAWQEFPLYVWRNVDGLVNGLGALLLPATTTLIVEKVLAVTLGVAGISGVVRRVRREPAGLVAPYAYFCLFYGLMLVVWHFPPNERFVLPMGPLWLLGIYTEFTHVGGVVRKAFRNPDRGQRVAGGVLVGMMTIVAGWCVARQAELLVQGMPTTFADHSRRFHDATATINYIREKLPAEATVLAEMDPTVFLRTNRRGARNIVTTIHWYHNDDAGMERDYANAADYCKRLGIGYILLNRWDYSRDLSPAAHAAIQRRLATDGRLELVFSSGPAALYRVR